MIDSTLSLVLSIVKGKVSRRSFGGQRKSCGAANRRVCGDFAEGLRDGADDVAPIAGGGLAEEAHGGIPRRIGASVHPAPVRMERQQKPDRAAESAGKVRDHGVHGDDQIQAGNRGCGGDDVGDFPFGLNDLPGIAVPRNRAVLHGVWRREFVRLRIALQAEELDAWEGSERRREKLQGDVALAIPVAGGPDDADVERFFAPAEVDEFAAARGDGIRGQADVWSPRGDRGERRAEDVRQLHQFDFDERIGWRSFFQERKAFVFDGVARSRRALDF